MYASFFKYIHHCICILVMVLCWGYRTSPSDSKVDMSDSESGKLVLCQECVRCMGVLGRCVALGVGALSLFYLHYLTVGIPDAGPGELLLVQRLPSHRRCPCHSQNSSLCKGDNSLVRSKQRWIQRKYYRAKGCYRFSFQKCKLLGFAVNCQS